MFLELCSLDSKTEQVVSLQDATTKEQGNKKKNNQEPRKNRRHRVVKEEHSNEESIFRSYVVKSYSLTVIKEEPVTDFNSLYNLEDNLQYEKQFFHQTIYNQILKCMDSFQLDEIQKAYMKHLQAMAEIETFVCSICTYKTINKENLKHHLFFIHNLDMETTWIQCMACDYKNKSQSLVRRHFERLHRKNIGKNTSKTLPKMLECDLCIFETTKVELFKKHKVSHRDPNRPKRFVCTVCSYGHTNKTNLARHLLDKHQIVTKRASQIKKLKCDFCDYTCHTTQYLNRHLVSHKDPDKVKMLSCEYCEFKTKYRMSLSYHIKNHKMTDEQLRTYMCEICSKRFKQKSKLDVHVITHKSIDEVSTIFKCLECPFKAKVKRNLEMHMAVHKDPEFVCDVCGHRSKRKDAHNRHRLTHKSDSLNVFKCSLCTYETHIKCYLKKHFKKHSHQGVLL